MKTIQVMGVDDIVKAMKELGYDFVEKTETHIIFEIDIGTKFLQVKICLDYPHAWEILKAKYVVNSRIYENGNNFIELLKILKEFNMKEYKI